MREGGGSISASGKYARAGGVAGDNSSTCTIKTCTVIVSGEISATTGTGGVAAYGKGTVADDCIVNDGSENDGSEIEQG